MGTVAITGELAPANPNDTYGIFRPKNQIGGYRVVDTYADMLAIPGLRLEAGMVVRVATSNITYILQSDLVTWTPDTRGGSEVSINFSYGDASPELIAVAPAGKVIESVELFLLTAFNGVTSGSLAVGDLSVPNSLSSLDDCSTPIIVESSPGVVYGTPTNIYLTIIPGIGTTQGNGVVTIRFQT